LVGRQTELVQEIAALRSQVWVLKEVVGTPSFG
jgi:hypothetical protein